MAPNWPPSEMTAPIRSHKVQTSRANNAARRRQVALERAAKEQQQGAVRVHQKLSPKTKKKKKQEKVGGDGAGRDQLEPFLEAALLEIEQQARCWWQAPSVAAADSARRASERARAAAMTVGEDSGVSQRPLSQRTVALFAETILHSPVTCPTPSPRLMPLPSPRSRPSDMKAAERDGPSAQPVLRDHDGKPWWWPKSLSLQKQRGQKIRPSRPVATKLEWEQRLSEQYQRPYWVERHWRQVVWRDPQLDQSPLTQQSELEPEAEPEPTGSQYAVKLQPRAARSSCATAAANQE